MSTANRPRLNTIASSNAARAGIATISIGTLPPTGLADRGSVPNVVVMLAAVGSAPVPGRSSRIRPLARSHRSSTSAASPGVPKRATDAAPVPLHDQVPGVIGRSRQSSAGAIGAGGGGGGNTRTGRGAGGGGAGGGGAAHEAAASATAATNAARQERSEAGRRS